MKTWKKIVRMLFLVVVIVPVATLIAIQIPAVQTYAVDKVSQILTKDIDGTANVGKVYLSFPNNLILKDVDIIQGERDTVAHIGKVLINLKTTSLVLSQEARIRRISLEDGRIHIRHINDSTTNLSRLIAPLTAQNKTDKTEVGGGLPWESISLDRLTLKDIDFAYDSLAVEDIHLSLRNARYEGSTAGARIERLSFRSGDLQVEECRADLAYDSTGVAVKDLRYDDGFTQLRSKRLALGFSDFSDFSDFLNKVDIDASLQNSRIDLHTLKPFLDLGGRELALWVDGSVKGSVNALQSDRFHIESATRQTRLELKFKSQGLPDLEHARLNAEILRGETTTADLADLIAGIQPGFKKNNLTRYAPGEPLNLTARLNGTLADLDATGHLHTATMGEADFQVNLGKQGKAFQAQGTASTQGLQLGRILGNPTLGALTCQTDISFAQTRQGLSVSALPLTIDHFTFKGYDYQGIVASGTLENGQVHADIVSSDPNLVLEGHGDITLGGKGAGNRYCVDLNVDHADLSALHLMKRDSAALSFALNADLTQTPDNAFLGTADIRAMQASIPGQLLDIGDISFESQQLDDRYTLTMESGFARAEYDGNIFASRFGERAYHIAYHDNLEHLFGGKHDREKDESHPEEFGMLTLRFLNLQPVTSFFLPDLFISPQSTLRANLENDEVTLGLSSELLAYDRNLLRNIQFRVLTEQEMIRAYVDADQLQAAGIPVENLDINALADSSTIDIVLAFHNEDGSGNRARLHTQVSFPDEETEGFPLRIDLLPSELAIADHPWELSPAVIRYRSKQIQIDDFSIRNGEQSLIADGVVGEAPTDTIRLLLNDFDLGMANSFLKQDFNLQGLLTGRGEAFALLGPEKGILFDMRARHVSAVGQELGNFLLRSRWDDAGKQFLVNIENHFLDRHPLVASASYHPSDKQVRADVQLDSMKLCVAEPLLTSLASHMDGTLSGHIKASGPIDKLELSSEGVRFNQFQFRLDYTQVDYIADGPVTLSSKGVTFDNVRLNDRFGHDATWSGGIPFDHFKDIRLNLRFDLRGIMGLNTTLKDNESFYGRAFADGSVRVSGDLKKIRLSLNVTPTENTTIHVPIGKSARQRTPLLTFINNEKELSLIDSMIQAKQQTGKTKKSSGSEVNVNLRVNATPDAEVQIEIDKNTGDILKARGNGQIGITVARSVFDIKGDYRVDSGSYHFGMLGFTSRDFSLDPGGTINFNGDVMDSDLDMSATYHTKASISPLIADSTAVGARRNVDCHINLTGKLANPEIKFNIDIPDLDPTIQSQVQSAFNTEDKRMKQALALLVSGGFVPDEQSGIVNSTTMLSSNASELMSSQLNNILRQLDIPIDLGFNYQPSANGRNIFDVAVSTQLFNNRVSINGNIGNRQYYSSSNSDIVGDLDIEIKLNRQGQLRLTLFSHSADQYSNYLDMSQRNGAGIVYQEDFSSFKELWRKIFHIKTDEKQAIPNPDAPRRIRTE